MSAPPPPPSTQKPGDQDKAQQAASKQVEQEDKVENMYGERILHIYIEESFGLSTGKEGDQIDAIIEVKAYDQKKYTNVQKGVTSSSQSYWGQHFFFEKDFRDKYELETELIEIRVYDHNTVGSNSLIGFFTFNQEMVYASENHCMLFKYYPVLNVEKDHKAIFGYVKASFHVARPGDNRVKLEDEPKLDRINTIGKGSNQIMLPPQIKIQKQQVEIRVVRAERVVKMDFAVIGTGTADPYMTFSFGGMTLKTKVCKDTLSPVWNQKILLPSLTPTINDRINVCLKDEDVTSDEVIGSFSLDFREAAKGTVESR